MSLFFYPMSLKPRTSIYSIILLLINLVLFLKLGIFSTCSFINFQLTMGFTDKIFLNYTIPLLYLIDQIPLDISNQKKKKKISNHTYKFNLADSLNILPPNVAYQI